MELTIFVLAVLVMSGCVSTRKPSHGHGQRCSSGRCIRIQMPPQRCQGSCHQQPPGIIGHLPSPPHYPAIQVPSGDPGFPPSFNKFPRVPGFPPSFVRFPGHPSDVVIPGFSDSPGVQGSTNCGSNSPCQHPGVPGFPPSFVRFPGHPSDVKIPGFPGFPGFPINQFPGHQPGVQGSSPCGGNSPCRHPGVPGFPPYFDRFPGQPSDVVIPGFPGFPDSPSFPIPGVQGSPCGDNFRCRHSGVSDIKFPGHHTGVPNLPPSPGFPSHHHHGSSPCGDNFRCRHSGFPDSPSVPIPGVQGSPCGDNFRCRHSGVSDIQFPGHHPGVLNLPPSPGFPSHHHPSPGCVQQMVCVQQDDPTRNTCYKVCAEEGQHRQCPKCNQGFGSQEAGSQGGGVVCQWSCTNGNCTNSCGRFSQKPPVAPPKCLNLCVSENHCYNSCGGPARPPESAPTCKVRCFGEECRPRCPNCKSCQGYPWADPCSGAKNGSGCSTGSFGGIDFGASGGGGEGGGSGGGGRGR